LLDQTPEAAALARTFKMAGLVGNYHSPEYWDMMQLLAPGRTVAITYDGNQHVAQFLFSPSFDFVLDDNSPTEPSAQLVPLALVREHFRPSVADLETNLTALSKLPGVRPIVLGTPAPFGDDAFIGGRLGEVADQANNMNSTTLPITPLSVRVKLWRVIQQLLTEVAEQCGVAFISSPEETRDSRGVLREEYVGNDLTHTNPNYGAVVVRALAAYLSEVQRKVQHEVAV
jgi:hypothetical protein